MSIQNIFFIDVETVPAEDPRKLSAPPVEYYKRFAKSLRSKMTEEEWDNFSMVKEYSENASLYAEFCKIVSISIGKQQATKFYVKTIIGKDEKIILQKFNEAMEKATNICAHNGLEFDFPILMRRSMILGLPIPGPLNVAGKKPWDITLEDTMKMWSGTQWNYKVSLELLCSIFGLPNPKEGMSGASVSDIYYGMFDVANDELPFDKEEAALKAIGKYNAGDVVALANVYCKMKGLPIIEADKIEYV